MNDPRITSYALGELTGREREEFERDLAASEDLQRELTETILVADALQRLPEPTDLLGGERRDALRRVCADNVTATRRGARFAKFATNTGALAASLTVILGITAFFLSRTVKLEINVAPVVARGPAAETFDSLPRVTLQAPPPAPRFDLAASSSPLATMAPPVDFAAGSSLAESAGHPPMVAALSTSQLQKQIEDVQPTSVATVMSGVPPATAGERGGFVSGNTGAPPSPKSDAALVSRGSASVASAGTGVAASAGVPLQGDIALRGRLFRSAGEAKIQRRLIVTPPRDAKDQGSSRSDFNTEAYDAVQENVFLAVKDNRLSTFSIDVDTASYANVRRFLQGDQLPPPGAIRIEELLNYFSYAYPQPEGEVPFSVNLEVRRAPWDASRELVRIGLKGRDLPASERVPANLVFLVDVSGSMDSPAKLPLLQRSLSGLVENLSPKDRVAIVVYAGSSGVVLPSTPGTDKPRILEALGNLKAGGSTNGASGIQLAYDIARKNFLKEGTNRVILCTDGDFNVGTTNQSELVRLIEKERLSGVFLSVLGFGSGNLKDSTMEKLADKGNGNYSYIDSLNEGRKVLVEQMGATLFTLAKDVKIQVEFNPARVAGYRLIGYENRLLAKEDFNDDKKDAGEIGAGHTVTAFYEVIPAGQALPDRPSVDPLKYGTEEPGALANHEELRGLIVNLRNLTFQEKALLASGMAEGHPKVKSVRAVRAVIEKQSKDLADALLNSERLSQEELVEILKSDSSELLTVKLRYKAPDGDKSKRIEVPLAAPEIPAFDQASSDFQFAAAVAAFGMKLRGSPTAGKISWSDIQKIVRANLGEDPGSYRAEFLTLIERAARLRPDGEAVEEAVD